MIDIAACEESGILTEAYHERGLMMWSVDILPTRGKYKAFHIQDDIFHVISGGRFIAIRHLIGFPPCRYLCNSGIKHLVRRKPTPTFEWDDKIQRFVNRDRWKKMEQAALFFRCLWNHSLPEGTCLENSIMHPYALELIGVEPTQIIQP